MQCGERFILVPNPEIKFKVKKPWQPEHGAANHSEFLGRKHKQIYFGVQFAFASLCGAECQPME